MDYRYNLRFVFFGICKLLTKKQKLLFRDNDKIKQVLKKSIANLNYVKFLDRVEPSISSLDEKKQLRMNLNNFYLNNNIYSLTFNQNCCWAVECFTMKELMEITESIEKELGIFFKCGVDSEIILEKTKWCMVYEEKDE
jgi:hypothetical protein